jgi:hypothetical protein
VGANGDAPAMSLLNPKENLGGVGTSGLIFGSYYGPGVPLIRFSMGNYHSIIHLYTIPLNLDLLLQLELSLYGGCQHLMVQTKHI